MWKSRHITSIWPHRRCDVGLEEGEYQENSVLQYCVLLFITVYIGTSSSYRSVNCKLYPALILLGVALSSEHLFVFSFHGAIYVVNVFAYIFFFTF